MTAQEVLSPLTADERTVLEIASHDEVMIETGRWKEPVLSLVKRGYLEGPRFNRCITDAGMAAFKAAEAYEERALVEAYQVAQKVGQFQKKAQQTILGMASAMVEVSNGSAKVTGDTPQAAATKWLDVLRDEVFKRLLERS